MRLPLFLLLLTSVDPIVAQGPTSQARIFGALDVSPPETDDPYDGEWFNLSGGDLPEGMAVGEFRIRISGTEGGWCHPVLGLTLDEAYTSAPPWLIQGSGTQAATTVNWGPCVFPAGDPQPAIWRLPTFQFYVDAALGMPWGPSTNAVRDWCQPFLSQNVTQFGSSTRLWTSAPVLWPQPVKDLWTCILADAGTGVPNPRLTAFSGGAAIRQAILMQSYLANNQSIDQGVAYLNSSGFKIAVANDWLFLMLQAFALRAANLPAAAPLQWPQDNTVPDLTNFLPPPQIGLAPSAKIAVDWPEHSGGGVSGLSGVVAGQLVSFVANWATPPVILTYQTSSGQKQMVAWADGTLDCPGLHRSRVPVDAIPGPIYYQAGLDFYPVPVGHVAPQLP